MRVLAILLIAAAGAAFCFFKVRISRKRRRAMEEAADRLGLRFSPGRNRELPRRFRFLDRLRRGEDRYAFNTFSGEWKGHRVVAGDFHYRVFSPGRGGTRHHYLSFFVLLLSHRLPELIIGREKLFSRIADDFRGVGVSFESHEFSRKFRVRSRDRKFAYDVCHPRMIEYLLENDDLSIEIETGALALTFNRRLDPVRIEANLDRLVEVRELLPGYLFSRTPGTGVDRETDGRVHWNPLEL